MRDHPQEASALRAAAMFGVLAAHNLASPSELLAALATVPLAENRDPAGQRARRAHRFADAAHDARLARSAAAGRIRAAIRPLLAAWAPAAAILRAAFAAVPGHEDENLPPLSRAEIRAIAEAEAMRRLRAVGR